MIMADVKDYSVNKGMKASELVDQMAAAGFQATEIGEAVRIIRKMK
jgi:deoxyhypusine synthase